MRGSRARLSGGMLYKQHIGEATTVRRPKDVIESGQKGSWDFDVGLLF